MADRKKTAFICIGAAVITAFAGCGAPQAEKAESGESGTPASSWDSSADAQTSSRDTESSDSSALAASSRIASSASEAAVFRTAPSAVLSKSDGAISVRMLSAEYKSKGNVVTAEYPQLDGNRYAGVNSAMEQEALSTMNNIKANGDPNKVTSSTIGRVEFSSESFISAAFETSFKTAANAHTFRALRTVNYNVKAGRAVTADDLLVKNGSFYKAVDSAVKKQLPKKYQDYFTRDVIEDCIDKADVYFKGKQIVVSLITSCDLDDHVEISLGYDETAGFRKNNAVWGYLIKK